MARPKKPFRIEGTKLVVSLKFATRQEAEQAIKDHNLTGGYVVEIMSRNSDVDCVAIYIP